ncbi:MAG: zinc-ribbon domain-containing protein [Bacteroidales bacterium]|nr:zinc-ribbon domain-containing protein [Bacteroidales bacterium]
MKKLLLSIGFAVMVLFVFPQQAFWLDVQPGKLSMPGDGIDYTTLVIAARDADGQVIPTVSGKVKVRVSSGFLDDTIAQMDEGVAMIRFTSPMFGTPIKSSQRMVYFMFKFMQKFIGRSAGSTNYQANQKLATDIAMETIKEGLNPIALIPKKDGDNFVYIVCELNGVKGKAKIEISKESDSPNGNIIPGMYYGRDITGQSDWYLDISSGGQGVFGEAGASQEVGNTIMFTTENFTEFNDAMGKMAGMTGFMKAYLGPPESETKYLENFNIREQGMPSAYMPMPRNGVFVYVPPILFEYAGRRTNGGTDEGDKQEDLKFEKTGIVFSQKEVVGDGRSRTKAVFHYEDENGVPVSGKAFSWEIPKSFKVISMQTVTDASGNAVAELEVPVIKAGAEKRGENTGALIENYDLFIIKANYTSSKGKAESTLSYLTVFKTLEQDLYLLKAGLEPFPYKVLLPQLEYYNLESSVYALLPEYFLSVPNKKTPLNDAMVFLPSRNFDKAGFLRMFEMYFKKDRKLLMTFLENEKGGFTTITDANGRFKLIVRDFEGKKRLYSGGYDRKVAIETLQAKISDLTGKRTGALSEVLGLLSAGADASGNLPADDGTFAGKGMSSFNYKEEVLTKLLNMERVLVSGSHTDAVYVEEKLHIIGMLMTNAKGTARFMGDTGKEIIENGWALLKMAWDLANEQFKITERLGKKVGFDKVSDSLAKIGMKIDLGVWSYLKGVDQKTGTRRIILDLIKKNVLASDAPNKNKASAAYYRMMGQASNAVSAYVFDQLTGGISDALSGANPIPDLIVEKLRKTFYAGLRAEVDKFLAQPPEKVHAIYPQLQLALRDRSTEIRSYYQDIASSRFNMEMYKADWDYFRDVVIKSAIIIYDVKTLNWASVKKHLKALENFNKVTDAAYTGTKFCEELWRYHNLWCEARGAFDFANRSVTQGVLVSEQTEPHYSFSFFNEAVAADLPGGVAVPGIAGIQNLDLALQNGRLPVENINKAIAASLACENWLQTNAEKVSKLGGYNPAGAGSVFSASSDYNFQMALLTVNALAYAESRSASAAKDYNAVAGYLKKGAASLNESTAKANEEIKTLPAVESVPVEAVTEENSPLAVWQNPLYQKIALGSLAGILILLMLLLLLRRRSKHKKRLDAAPLTQNVVQPSRPAVKAETNLHGSMFCPKCGAALKPGAKFCARCGHKLIV